MADAATIDSYWTRERIASLPAEDLRAIIRSTNPNGTFWPQVMTARETLAALDARSGGAA